MSEAAEKLKPALAALTAAERAEVVEFLLEFDEEGEELTQEEWEVAWVEEAERRLESARSGKTVGIPAEDFMKQMKEKYG